MAEQILSYDYTQSARFIVDSMRLLMEGGDDGAEEALRVAARWFEASRDREQAPPVASPCVVPVQTTQNRFLPLAGQPISGKCWFGPVKIQSPICPAAASSSSVTAVANKLLACDTWEVGECECDYYDSECNVRVIAFPNAGNLGIDKENRTVMDLIHDNSGRAGRLNFCVTPLPRWVAVGLAEGLQVGGTCVHCGNLVTLGADSGGDDGVFEHKEVTAEAPAPADNGRQHWQGERWAARSGEGGGGRGASG
jgi:hypothetical protein